jgi:hypothetical protein
MFRPLPSRFVRGPADRDPTDVNDLELAFVEDARFVWRFEAF